MMLKYNANTGDYVLFSDDVKKAQQVGFDLSTSVRGPKGEQVWFSREPYAALSFWNEAHDSVKIHLSRMYEDYVKSQAIGSDNIYPSPDGLTFLPYQKAGIAYALPRRNCLIGDEMGLGKLQPMSVKIIQDTPKGWTTMGELKVGSVIFGGDGKPCKVTAIYPQGVKPSYRITFRDGTHTHCGAEHLWVVKDRNRITRGKDWTVKSLQELMDRGITYPKKGDSKWQIPIVQPIEFSEKDLLVDPYILGVLIGDGYLGGSSIQFSNPDMDADINKRVKKLLPIGYSLKEERYEKTCPRYVIIEGINTRKNLINISVGNLGLKIKSGKKFIPEIYKISSVYQRMEMLKGLMDTDGSCRKNRTTYHTISTKLANDIADLVRSLGGVAIVRGYDRSHEGKPYEYQVNVKTMFCPFHTSRKAAEWKVPAEAQSPKKFITKVEYVGDEEQQCIAVDSPDHLYVTDDYIVTHNTVEAIGVNNSARETKNLVICPASIRLNWQREIIKWSTIPNVTTYPVLKSLDGINPYANYTIISYDLCRNEDIHAALMDIEWDSMIFDEAHFLKTEEAKRTRAMFGGGRGPFKDNFLTQQTKRVLALTGTPLPNRPRECFTLAKALCYESIDWMSFDEFCYRFNPSGLVGKDGHNREEHGRLPELRARLRCNFMVRRLKKHVLKDLPSKRYEMSYIEPNGAIEKVLTQERLVEFDPYRMFDGNFKLDGTPISTLRREMGEAKVPRVIERMKYLLDIVEVPKIVLFSHHKSVMDRLAQELQRYGIVSHRGGMTPKAKQASIDDFIADRRVRIFSCQLDTTYGLDGLQKAASRLVFAEPAWTPGTNEQAVDRCHRIGQHDNVIAEFLISAGSFDELVLNAVLKKSKTIHVSLDQGCGELQ